MGIDTTRISDLVLGKLSPEEALRLLKEIERDPRASEELEVRARLLAHAQQAGDSLFPVREQASLQSRILYAWRRWLRRPLAGYALGAATLLLIVLIPLVSKLSQGPYVDLARVDRPQYEAVLRSAGGSDIDLAVRMLRSGHPKESLLLLERFCRAYPESDMREYAHYLAGAIYLSQARESFLGMFVSYDAARVQAGLAHLEEVVRLSQNPRLAEESHWLRAKGFLMLDRPAESLAELQTVRDFKGQRYGDAADLMRMVASPE